MTYISTLGQSTRAIITLEENESLDKSFTCAALIPSGTPVKLLNTGLVAAVTAVTDVVFGVCSVGNTVAGGKVTVKTPFVAVMVAEADGTVDEADNVACSGMNTAGVLPKMKTAVTTNWVSGICLTGGATTTEIIVGILRNGRLI